MPDIIHIPAAAPPPTIAWAVAPSQQDGAETQVVQVTVTGGVGGTISLVASHNDVTVTSDVVSGGGAISSSPQTFSFSVTPASLSSGTFGGTYALTPKVVVDSKGYYGEPKELVCGILDQHVYYVTIYDDTFTDSPAVDFTSLPTGSTWTRAGKGFGGADQSVVANHAATTFATSADGLTLASGSASIQVNLSALPAAITATTQFRAQVLSAGDYSVNQDRVQVYLANSTGSERETVGRYNNGGGGKKFIVTRYVASTTTNYAFDSFTDGAVCHFALGRCGGGAFLRYHDDSMSTMPSAPTLRGRWTRTLAPDGTATTFDRLLLLLIDGGGGAVIAKRLRIQAVI